MIGVSRSEERRSDSRSFTLVLSRTTDSPSLVIACSASSTFSVR